MDKETAIEITGGLSHPSKMPGYGYGIPAQECKVGGHLQRIEGSVCADCYALKGMYYMPNVKTAQRARFESLDHPHWVEAMAFLIATVEPSKRDHFRWHDAGDLQDMTHLLNIVEVCRLTPEVKHYLPTKEKALVLSYIRQFGDFPDNLVVRLSAPMVDGGPSNNPELLTSTVHDKRQPIGVECPARAKYDNTCGPCRACWDRSVPNVSYPLH